MNALRTILVLGVVAGLATFALLTLFSTEDVEGTNEPGDTLVSLDGRRPGERGGRGRGRSERTATDDQGGPERGVQVLRGQVRDASGAGLPDAVVEFRLKPTRDTVATAASDAGGGFALEGLPQRSGWLAVQHAGTTQILPTAFEDGAFETSEVSFAGGTIEGTVLTAQRRPAEGVKVVAAPTRRPTSPRAPQVSLEVTTDGQGRFRLAHVGEEEYAVAFHWIDCEQPKQASFERPVRVGERDLLFVQPHVWQWTLIGTVVDGATGEPIAGAKFQAATGEPSVTDAQGVFRKTLCFTTNELPEGSELPLPYGIVHDDYPPERGRTLLAAGSGELDLGTIALYRTTTWTQPVRDDEGNPIAGAEIVLLGPEGYERTARTNNRGEASFEGVRQGVELRALVGASGFEPLTFQPVPPQADPVTLSRVNAEAEVRGVVIASQLPTHVSLESGDPFGAKTPIAQLPVGEDGTFVLPAPAPGGKAWFAFQGPLEGTSAPITWFVERGLSSVETVHVESPSPEASLFVHGLNGGCELLLEGASLAGRWRARLVLMGEGERIDLRGLPRARLRVRRGGQGEIVHDELPEELHL